MNKARILLIAAVTLAAVLSALAQEQAQGPTTSQSPAIDLQGVRNYLLGPGDVLDVRVFGQSDLNTLAEIDADGNISSLPFLEKPIRAQCLTEKEVQKAIATAYAAYIKNPQVSVRIAERKSRQPATISGAVKNPMQVLMMRSVRLHELITKAGGITERASGTVVITHTQPEMCPEPSMQKVALSSTEDLGTAVYKLSDYRMGKEEADPYIRPGDMVDVHEGEPVYVIGLVNAPQKLVLRDQLTLHRAILMSGGVQSLAKTNEVVIWRQKEGKPEPEKLTCNYDEIKRGRAKDVLLQANDVIEVGKSGLMTAKGASGFLRDLVKSSASAITMRGVIP